MVLSPVSLCLRRFYGLDSFPILFSMAETNLFFLNAAGVLGCEHSFLMLWDAPCFGNESASQPDQILAMITIAMNLLNIVVSLMGGWCASRTTKHSWIARYEPCKMTGLPPCPVRICRIDHCFSFSSDRLADRRATLRLRVGA